MYDYLWSSCFYYPIRIYLCALRPIRWYIHQYFPFWIQIACTGFMGYHGVSHSMCSINILPIQSDHLHRACSSNSVRLFRNSLHPPISNLSIPHEARRCINAPIRFVQCIVLLCMEWSHASHLFFKGLFIQV